MCSHTGNYDDCPECRELSQLRFQVDELEAANAEYAERFLQDTAKINRLEETIKGLEALYEASKGIAPCHMTDEEWKAFNAALDALNHE